MTNSSLPTVDESIRAQCGLVGTINRYDSQVSWIINNSKNEDQQGDIKINNYLSLISPWRSIILGGWKGRPRIEYGHTLCPGQKFWKVGARGETLPLKVSNEDHFKISFVLVPKCLSLQNEEVISFIGSKLLEKIRKTNWIVTSGAQKVL